MGHNPSNLRASSLRWASVSPAMSASTDCLAPVAPSVKHRATHLLADARGGVFLLRVEILHRRCCSRVPDDTGNVGKGYARFGRKHDERCPDLSQDKPPRRVQILRGGFANNATN